MLTFFKNLFFGELPPDPSSSSSSAADTAPSSSAVTDEKRKSEDFVVKKSDILCSSTSHYLVCDFTGEGQFGKVAKCVNLITSQEVALKILKTKDSKIATREIRMLEKVSVLDPVGKNVVSFLDQFQHQGHTCLAFELLDRSLAQLVMDRHMEPLSLSEIRPIAKQLLTAYDALKAIGVIHADVKPENIMLVNHVHEPFRVKLVDFSRAFTLSEYKRGMTTQAVGYAAPEVALGLPIAEAIDMWGLGCVLAFLYLGKHPFAITGKYEMMRDIVKSLGQPADRLLDAGDFTHKYFKRNHYWIRPRWWLKTPREYQLDACSEMPQKCERSFESLDGLITLYPVMQESIELDDKTAFVRLMKCFLEMDREKRITPEEALKHPFVSMAHMEAQRDTSTYVDKAFTLMLVVPNDEDVAPPVDKVDEEAVVLPLKDKALAPPPLSPPSSPPASPPSSCDGSANTPPSDDAAAAAGVTDTTGTAEEETAVCQSAASPAEETSATESVPPVKEKKSRLKRCRKSFGRAMRTLFCMKRRD